MKQLFNPLLFVLMLAAFGCSAPQQQTESTFKVGTRSLTASSASLFPGGLILYGVSGSQSFSRVMTTDSQNEVIPNGVWDFHVIGWDGNSNVGESLSGKVYCASQTGVELNGEPVTINLTASNSNCTKAAFGPNVANVDRGDGSGTSNWFPLIDVETCNKLGAADCRYNPAVDGTYSNNRGVALSYRVIAHSYDRLSAKVVIPPGTGKLASGCAKVDTSNADGTLTATETFADTYLNIPYSSNMIFTLRAYLGSDSCDDSFGFRDIHIGSNLNPEPRVSVAYDGTDTNVVSAVTTMKDICSNPADLSGSTVAPFSGGNGDIGSPYVICHNWQLNEIAHLYNAKNFIVAKPLDMNSLTVGYADATGPTPVCGMTGMTFIPIGGVLDAEHTSLGCTTTDYQNKYGSSATIGFFNGVFDGNFQQIKGIRIKMSESPNPQVGFVRSLGPSGKILNMRLRDFEVEGPSLVGLVGKQGDASNDGGTIYDVEIVGGEARAESGSVGSIVGANFQGDIIKARVKKFKVISRNGVEIGGIAGKVSQIANAGVAKEVSFEGKIEADTGTSEIGGIVGFLGDGGILTNAVSRGQIFSKGYIVGGLVGYSFQSSIENSYSNMFVSSFAQADAHVGGLVGRQTAASSSTEYSYFSGEVAIHPFCSTNCSLHPIGATGGQDKSTTDTGTITGTGLFLHTDVDLLNTHPGMDVTEANLKLASTMDANLNPAGANAGVWDLKDGRYPKLVFEDPRICDNDNSLASVGNQRLSLNMGSAENPVVICTQAQFHEFLDGHISGHYILGESILMGVIPESGDPQRGLNNGVIFDGRGKSLMAGVMQSSAGSAFYGVFGDIQPNALLKNLHLSAIFAPTNTNVQTASGLVAGKNQGSILNLIVTGYSHYNGNPADTFGHISDTGLVVGQNLGTIERVKAMGVISGNKNLGGIAAYNSGIIKLAKSEVDIYGQALSSVTVASQDIGGIVGVNDGNPSGEGKVEQCAVFGQIDVTGSTGNHPTLGNIGLLVGANISGGVVFNSFVEDSATLMFKGYVSGITAQGVGGLVGFNDSSVVSKSFTRGMVKSMGAFTGTYSGFIGKENSSTHVDGYFENYLVNDSLSPITDSTTDTPLGDFTDTSYFSDWNYGKINGDGSGQKEAEIVDWYLATMMGQTLEPPVVWEMSSNGLNLFGLND